VICRIMILNRCCYIQSLLSLSSGLSIEFLIPTTASDKAFVVPIIGSKIADGTPRNILFTPAFAPDFWNDSIGINAKLCAAEMIPFVNDSVANRRPCVVLCGWRCVIWPQILCFFPFLSFSFLFGMKYGFYGR